MLIPCQLREAFDQVERFKESYDWTNTIAYLNANDIEYAVESGRGTKWSDLDIYTYYLENKEAIDNFEEEEAL